MPSATASSGPRGRGAKSGSQVPHTRGTEGPTSSENALRSEVFPTPASPLTSVRWPCELVCTSPSDPLSVASSLARSRSPLCPVGRVHPPTWRTVSNHAPSRPKLQARPGCQSQGGAKLAPGIQNLTRRHATAARRRAPAQLPRWATHGTNMGDRYRCRQTPAALSLFMAPIDRRLANAQIPD